MAAPCPNNSIGIHIPSGCQCNVNAGYLGIVNASLIPPVYATSTCQIIDCPNTSTGNNVGQGCSCKSGSFGIITPLNKVPWFIDTCIAVVCPVNSTGSNVRDGCTCNAGFSGSVIATTIAPDYFVNGCTAVSCPSFRFFVFVFCLI